MSSNENLPYVSYGNNCDDNNMSILFDTSNTYFNGNQVPDITDEWSLVGLINNDKASDEFIESLLQNIQDSNEKNCNNDKLHAFDQNYNFTTETKNYFYQNVYSDQVDMVDVPNFYPNFSDYDASGYYKPQTDDKIPTLLSTLTLKRTGKLWEFLRNLLLDEKTCPSLIKWVNFEEGMFKFVKSERVAELWGNRKNNKKMNYEKLSRAMRYYYRSKVLLPVAGRRLVYKFGPQATGWRTDRPIL